MSEENAEDTVEKEAVERIAKKEIEETEIVEESEGESEGRKINIVGMKGPSQCFLGRSFLLQRVIPDYG